MSDEPPDDIDEWLLHLAQHPHDRALEASSKWDGDDDTQRYLEAIADGHINPEDHE